MAQRRNLKGAADGAAKSGNRGHLYRALTKGGRYPMLTGHSDGFLFAVLDILTAAFVTALAVLALWVLGLYVVDATQTRNAIRHNYPVIGRFRNLFEHLGTFFRQYFFAMDREELPFNRAERSWVYRAARNVDETVPFGSTRDLRPLGSVYFVNCPFPSIGEDTHPPDAVTIGPYCNQPYITESLFNISALSYGAISRPALLALSRGAQMAGCWLNTGEGGLSPYHLEGGADLVFQIGTAKYGVRDRSGHLNEGKLREVTAHDTVRMVEIKLSQGAKPGKGGILPAVKVTPEIAAIRGIPPYQASISPNRHVEISSVGELLDMIERVRTIAGKPVGFKAVVGAGGWLDELFAEIHRRGIEAAPDFITLDGAEGGSGAAPMSLMDNMGIPLRESLPLLTNKLIAHDLRERIKIVAAGKLITPVDVAWALCMGADFVNSARGFMFALGCIQALQCDTDTCPTGITTHNLRLQRGLDPHLKAVRVCSYAQNMVHEVGTIAHACGVSNPRDLRRFHARMVTETGVSLPLDEIYPEPRKGAASVSLQRGAK